MKVAFGCSCTNKRVVVTSKKVTQNPKMLKLFQKKKKNSLGKWKDWMCKAKVKQNGANEVPCVAWVEGLICAQKRNRILFVAYLCVSLCWKESSYCSYSSLFESKQTEEPILLLKFDASFNFIKLGCILCVSRNTIRLFSFQMKIGNMWKSKNAIEIFCSSS